MKLGQLIGSWKKNASLCNKEELWFEARYSLEEGLTKLFSNSKANYVEEKSSPNFLK
jgi:hypothetical protein